ncbi:MAG: alpha/beta fold hydrolase [bacterium]
MEREPTPADTGNTYVLVHGSWHGSWCWEKVVALLQQQGHNAIVLDLPGRAGDPTPARQLTLDSYAEKVCRVIALQRLPVILVGHSMAGTVVSQAAEYCAPRIKKLVYLCAFLLRSGQSLWQFYHEQESGLTLAHIVRDERKGVLTFTEDAPLREIFYHDCSEFDFARARAMLVPEPFGPREFAVRTSAERFGRVPRVYLETLQDRSIPIDLQKKMVGGTPCEKVISIDTGHSPFYAAPEELVSHLVSL